MKRTFSTTFFRRALFLVLLFGGVTNLWGDTEVATLSFSYTQAGHPDGQSAPQTCNSFDDKDKVIMDGDFTYSKGNDEIVMGDGYAKINNGLYACTRNAVNLPSGTLKFTIRTKKFVEDGKVNTPTISIDGGEEVSYSGGSELSYTKDEVKDLEYTITIEDAGNHDIKIKLPSAGQKFGVYDLKITSTGGPTPTPTPTCTNTLTIEAEDTALMVAPDGKTLPNYYVNKDERGNTSGNISTLISQASAGQFIAMKVGETSKYLYYKFSTSQAASFTIKIKASNLYNGKNGDVILYSTKSSNSESITVEGTTYKKVTNFQASADSGNQQWCETNQQNISEQPADDFILAVSSTDYWTMYYDKFDITASSDVFCFETYALTLSNDGHGSAESNQSDDSAIPKGTKVTITAIPNIGYAFDKWNDGSTTNPRTITVTNNATYTAYFKKSTKVCTNTLTIECEEADKDHQPNYECNTNWTENGKRGDGGTPPATHDYIFSETGQEKKKIYYPFEISDNAQISFSIQAAAPFNYSNFYIYLFRTTSDGGEKAFTYEGFDYYLSESCKEVKLGDNAMPTDGTWKTFTSSLLNLTEGKYIFALASENWQGAYFDNFTITANKNVFCTEVPATGYEITKGTHAGGDFTIKADGEEVTEATAGTEITLTSTPNTGYQFDSWDVYETDDSSNKVTVTNNTFEMPEFDVTVNATFKAQQYTITYKDQGGAEFSGNHESGYPTTYTYGVGATLKSATKTGYTFGGWYEAQDCTGAPVTIIGTDAHEAKTLYAKWIKLHTVTFDVNGHSSAPAAQQVADGGKVTQPANPQAMGWGFDGWYKEQACTHAWNFSTDVVTKDTTLYAKWNVGWEFYCNSESNVGHKLIDNGDGTLTWTQHIDANITDYFHFGDGSGYCYAVTDEHIMDKDNCTDWKVYQNRSTYVGLRTTAAGDYVFTVTEVDDYATQLNVSVTYPASVGVNINYQGHGGNNYTIYTNPNCTIANKDLPQTPSADGYKFWGWYANSECTTPFDFTAPITANTTAYAKWTLYATSTYTMHLQNTEGGDKANFIHTEASSPYYYIFDFAIPATTYSENFFVGNNGKWYSSGLGYKNSKSANWWYGWLPFTNLQGKGSNITLGSASGAIGTLRIVDNSGDENLYISFDPQGYGLSYGTPDQSGWVDMAFTQENSGTVWNTVPVTLTTDMLSKNFYVGLAKQGGGYVYSSRSDNNMVGFSNNVAFTTMGVMTQASTFRSGNLSSADAGQVGHFQIWTDNTAQNGCCHFVLHYNATFVYNNAQADTHTEYKSCLADNIITFPTPEAKTGYTFEGWYDNSSFTGTKYDAGSEFNLTNTGSKTFYAKWTPKTSHITFNANGGKIEGYDTKVLDYIYDGSTLTLPTPNWTGHHFEGWFTETTGGTQIDNVGGTNKPLEDVEYFAQWTINQHNLTWADIEGATLTGDYTKAGLVNYGTTLVAPTTVSKTGYEFTGWNPTVATTMPDNDVTYTATWTIINYTITYYNVEASEHTNPETYTITSADITLSAPTARTGYEFGGWYIDSNFQTSITQITTGNHENKDIYAKWTAKQYTITLDKNADDGNGGSVKVTYNSSTTTEFSSPTRDNYIVEGFYAENGCTTKVMNADGTLCTSVENYTDASGNWVKDATCTLYTKWAEKPKVDALIVTGDVNSATHDDGYASFTYTHPEDAFFGHKVLKIEYSGMSGNYGNSIISIDNGYQSSSSTGATGFGFWYKTDAGVTSIAFCLDYNNKQDQKKTQLPGTNGAWKYVYVKSSHASGWNDSKITIWMNGQDKDAATGNWTPSTLPHSGETTNTYPSSGVLYISEIRATEITEKFINHTVTFTPPSQGSTSAQIKDGATINSGDEVPEGTQVIFTWEKATGYDFVNFSDGKNTYTQNPCTLPVNSNLNITTNVKVEVPKYYLTVNVNDNDMGTATGTGEYAEDEEVSLTATPNEHYRFVNWTVEEEAVSTDANYTYTMPNKATTIVANFEDIPQHTITVNVAPQCAGQGTVTGSGTYYEGTKVTITATPNTGYAFDKWNDDDTNASREITVSQSQTYTAYFKVDYCSNTFTIQCEENRIEPTGGTGKPNNLKIIDNTKDLYYINAHSNDGVHYYVDFKNSTGEIYYFVHLPAATYNFDVYLVNSGSTKVRLYSPNGTGSKTIQWNSTSYKQVNTEDNWTVSNGAEGEHASFAKSTISNKTLEDGDYIISLRTDDSWAAFDQIVITADSKVFCPEMYTVNFAAYPSDKGTVTAAIKNGDAITSGTEVPENTVVVFTASDIASGYEVVNWTDGKSHELAGNVTSFEQTITDNITVTANIALIQPKYTVTATAGDEHGTITSGADDYREGATVTIVTAPDANYKVGSATASNVSEFTIEGNNVSFTMPAAAVDVTINFVFDTVHNMIATGTRDDYNSGKDGYKQNASLTLSSIADPSGYFNHNVLNVAYTMNNITENDNSYYGKELLKDDGYMTNNKVTGYGFWYMTEKADDQVYFEFKGGNGYVFKLPATNGSWVYKYIESSDAKTQTSFEIYFNGKKDNFAMNYNSGNILFSEIQATNVTSQEPIVPPVDLTVEVSPDEGGSVTTSPATTTGLVKGTPVTLTATPADNYRFVNWTVGGAAVSTEATYNRIVNATETITANFVRVYTLTINNDGNGTATVSPNQTKFAEGDKFTLTAQPTAGYAFDYYMDGDNKIETDPYEFTMSNSDRTISVHFKESINYYDINTAVSGEGTVTITVGGASSDGKNILEGTQVTLTATASDESHGFSQWQDGNKDNPRTIIANETNAAITWTATFAQVYTVSVELGAPGKEVIGVGKYAGGAQVTLTAVANTKDSQGKAYDLEYQLKEWTAQSVDISGHEYDNPLTFEMPYTSVNLKATFAPVECVDTKTIQCETDGTYIKFIEQGEDLSKYPSEIPHSENCGPFSDYYKGWHGTGYYDFKEATNTEMYYPVELPASTYKFEVWSASNGDKDCYMNLYVESNEDNPDIIYKGVSYKKTSYVTANNNCGAKGNFILSGTIDEVVLSSPQSVIVGLHCNQNYGSFDQIVITATEAVFCAPLPTTDFVIQSGEIKEIPVCGVDNLTIYDGGQANNNDDVEVFKQVKYSRTVNDLDKWETFAVPYNANEITVQDIPHKDLTEYTINPIYGEEGKYNAGYFYMEELKGEDATLVGRPFATRWEISLIQYPQQNVPYIIRFPHEQSNGYFANTQINYKYKSNGAGAGGASVTLTGKKNATIIEEDYPGLEEKPTFYFYANNTLANIQLETSAYILNESGMNFDIQDRPIIPPFHCYVQATQEIKQLYPRLAMRRDDSGGGVTTELIPISVEEMNAAHVEKFIKDDMIYILRDNKIYTVMGQPVK